MARYPSGVWRPLREADDQPTMIATQVILHSAVDAPGPTSLFGYFNRADVDLESHFYVALDGKVEQYVDTGHTADANRTANVRAISIETEDDGNPDQRPWSERQIAALVRLVDWCCRTHGIPRRIVRAHDAPGIGWHSMFGAPSKWTPVAGKTCPGRSRIAQIPGLVRAVVALDAPTPTPATPVDLSGETMFTYEYLSGSTRVLVLVADGAQIRLTGADIGARRDRAVETHLGLVGSDEVERFRGKWGAVIGVPA